MDFTDIELSGKTRREHDLLGEMDIPVEYYFGVQTMRAVENFHISRVRLNFFPELIRAMADFKLGAAMANRDLGLLYPAIADAIIRACEEQRAGKLEEQFLLDIAKLNRSYARTSSGVTYTVTDVGDQNQVPTSERDSVALRWVIRTAAGDEITSSYERGDTVRSLVRNLRRGVQESVKLIGKGGKINAWMPSSAAYGAEGDKELGVAPNATLYFEIELVDLDKYTTRSRRR